MHKKVNETKNNKLTDVAVFCKRRYYFESSSSYECEPYICDIGKKIKETETMILVEIEREHDIYERYGFLGLFSRKTSRKNKEVFSKWFTKNGNMYSVESIEDSNLK